MRLAARGQNPPGIPGPFTLFAMAAPVAFFLAAPALSAQRIAEVTGRDRLIEHDFEEIYRVGVVAGESWEMFGAVGRVGFDAAGNLYVFDRSGDGDSRDARVVVFDPAGAFVREFGSAGEGPGEFKRANGMAVMRDGTTVVRDGGHDAYHVFDPSGTFVRMVRFAEQKSKVRVISAIHADPRGGAVFTPEGGGGAGDAAASPSRPVVRLGLAGEVVDADTAALGWLPPRGGEGMEASIEVAGGTFSLGDVLGGFAMPGEFEPEVLLGVLPEGGLVYSDSSAYALKVTPPGSPEVERVIARPFHPEPVTESVRKEYGKKRSGREGTATGIGTNDEGATVPFALSFEMPERTFFPEIPVLRGLSATWEGRIWVQRRGKEPESDGPIDVLTVRGEYLGTFHTDAATMPDAFGPDGMAAFIELDELDVASVVVRRLPPAIR